MQFFFGKNVLGVFYDTTTIVSTRNQSVCWSLKVSVFDQKTRFFEPQKNIQADPLRKN